MIYLAAPAGLIAVIAIWVLATARRQHKRKTLKQERLSSAFDRSYAVRNHGDGAQGITQNLRIASLIPTSSKIRRA